jgi:hypothetical protein
MGLGAQNIKTEPGALDTTVYGSESTKLENRTRRPRYRRKPSPGAQNMKTGPDAAGTAENGSGRAKHKNGTRRPRYRRK